MTARGRAGRRSVALPAGPARATAALAVVVAVAAGVSLGGAFASGAAAAGPPEPTAAGLLADARTAATSYDFTGEVEVTWRADGGVHRDRMPVSERDGVLRLGTARSSRIVGAGDDRVMARDGVWTRLWAAPTAGSGAALDIVDPSAKYQLRVTKGPKVAGRPTTRVEARPRPVGDERSVPRAARVTESFLVDDATHLLLRRTRRDADGVLERRVSFEHLRGVHRVDDARQATDATTPRGRDTAPAPVADADVDDGVKAHLGRGFDLTGTYRAADHTVQRFYSDGIYSASVFVEPGALDRHDLPDDASRRDVGGRTTVTYSTASANVAVWSDGDRVFTVVSDAPTGDLAAIVRDLPEGSDPSMFEQIADFVLAPFDW